MRLLDTGSRTPPAQARRRPAVFIDKDGTLIEDVPYNVDPELLRFTPHAVEALGRLAAAGHLIVVISNQPGLALGRFDLPALHRLAAALADRLAAASVVLDGFYACPHRPASEGVPGCHCRKPAPGLLLQAAAELSIDLDRSWMVGDILDDVEAGRRAGCRAIHLDVGHETVWLRTPWRQPTATVPNLGAAADVILTGAVCSEGETGLRRASSCSPSTPPSDVTARPA